MAGELAKLFVTLGLDDKEFVSSMKRLQTTLTNTGKMMTGIGASITAALGLTTKAAMDEAVGINRLSNALKSVGKDYDSLSAQIEGNLSAIQKKTNYGDSEQRDALVELIGITGKYEGSLNQLELATNLAAAKNMDLVSAATLIGRVATGNTELLSRYGIAVTEGATATETLADMQQRFAGAAEAAANPLTQLKNDIGDLVEDIGSQLLPVLKNVADKIRSVVDKIRNWIGDNPKLTQTIVKITAVIGGLFTVLGPILMMLPSLAAGFTLLLGPVGLVMLAVTGLAAVGTFLALNWDKVSRVLKDTWDNIKIAFATAVKWIINTVLLPWVEITTKQIGVIALGLAKFVGLFNQSAGAAIEGFAKKMLNARQEVTAWADGIVAAAEESKGLRRAEEAARQLTAVIQEQFANQVKIIKDSYDEQRAAAQSAHDDAVAAINDEYGVAEEAAKDIKKTKVQLAKEAAAELKKQYDREKAAAKDRYDAEKRAIEDTYDAKMRVLDDEYDAQVRAIDKQIDDINDAAKAERLVKARADEQAKLAELKTAIDIAQTDEDRARAQAAYDEYVAEVAENEAERARDAQIEALEDAKDAAREAYLAKKKDLEDAKTAELLAIEETLNAELNKYDQLIIKADEDLKTELGRIETERLEKIKLEDDKLTATVNRLNDEEKAETERFLKQLADANKQVADINAAWDDLKKEYTITVTTKEIKIEDDEDLNSGEGNTSTSTSPFATTASPPSPIAGIQPYASGGPITEPTLLYGLKSHKPYAIAGEDGPEYVSPMRTLGNLAAGGFKTANIFIELDGRPLGNALGVNLVELIRAKTGVRV